MSNEKLKGFIRHRVYFKNTTNTQAYGDCVFCGKENKFYVNQNTQLWDCKVCLKKGNYLNFLSEISKQAQNEITHEDLEKLSTNRGLPGEAFLNWKIGKQGNNFLIPIYDAQGKLQDLRTYILGKAVMSSPGCLVGLLGMDNLIKEDTKLPVYICEGEWDGIALTWLLNIRLRIKSVVVAVPGAGTFKKEWISLFKDRDVSVLYDNDEPGENGELIVKERLNGVAKSLKFIHWSPSLPSGFDIRDLIVEEAVNKKKPRATFKAILELLSSETRKKPVGEIVDTIKAKREIDPSNVDFNVSLDDVFKVFKKWLFITDTHAIEMALASVLSNELQGDPVWMFLVAPPGGSKTEILNTFDKCPNVYLTSSLTPHSLVSGATYKSGTDPSLLPKLNGKTLILKDFTSIMGKKETEKDEIFGILRDAYDGKSGKVFGNGVERYYESHFSILSGVTPSIYELSGQYSGLGERFLKFFIGNNLEHENEINIIEKAIRNVNNEKVMRGELSEVVSKFILKMTYIMNQPGYQPPEIPESMMLSLIRLAQWGAKMRGVIGRDRYTQDMITSRPSAEVGSRLGKQLAKILRTLPILREANFASEHEFMLVRKTMLDTISQRDEDIFRLILKSTPTINNSISALEVSVRTRYPRTTVSRVLDNMNLLGILTRCGTQNKYSWTISENIRELINVSGLYSTKEELERPIKMLRRKIRFKRS